MDLEKQKARIREEFELAVSLTKARERFCVPSAMTNVQPLFDEIERLRALVDAREQPSKQGETWYCWKQLALVEGEEAPRLLTPWADPDVYEHSFDYLFETRDEAVERKREMAPGEEWLLCIEQTIVLEVADTRAECLYHLVEQMDFQVAEYAGDYAVALAKGEQAYVALLQWVASPEGSAPPNTWQEVGRANSLGEALGLTWDESVAGNERWPAEIIKKLMESEV